MGFRKNLEAMQLALANKLPFIIWLKAPVPISCNIKSSFGRMAAACFCSLGRLSAAGVPTMTVLHGPSTAGGAYMPGMSDYNVGVKHNGMAALSGAALVQAATGEIADERELGGSEMHASVSGLIEYLAEDDADGIRQIRDVVANIGWNERARLCRSAILMNRFMMPRKFSVSCPVDYKFPMTAAS